MGRAMYEQHADLQLDNWWFVARRAIIARVLRTHLGVDQDRSILDVGCGAGGMLSMLSEFGTPQGIEPDQLSVEHCRRAYGEFEIVHGRVPEDIPDVRKFDLVTAFDVIEHIHDDGAAVKAMRRAAVPGGTVVITVPALPWLWGEHDELNGHYRRYSERTLRSLMGAAGLEIRHLSHYNTVLLPVVVVARLLQQVRPSNRPPASDNRPIPGFLNRTLQRVMASEQRLAAGRGLSIGVSMIAVADVAT